MKQELTSQHGGRVSTCHIHNAVPYLPQLGKIDKSLFKRFDLDHIHKTWPQSSALISLSEFSAAGVV
jgi:hypothetical protein